jgi:hypothetical protein
VDESANLGQQGFLRNKAAGVSRATSSFVDLTELFARNLSYRRLTPFFSITKLSHRVGHWPTLAPWWDSLFAIRRSRR